MDFPIHSVMPIFYNDNPEIAIEIAKACIAGGSKVIELVKRGPKAEEVFIELRKFIDSNYPNVQLGIGTILDKESAKYFFDQKADFIISPFLIEEVGEFCVQNNVRWIPGCFSPTEVFNAHKQGAYIVKIYPGDAIQPSYVKSIKNVLPEVKIMVTGGVNPNKEEIESWFQSGADYIGMGSQLMKKEWISNREFEKITNTLKSI